MPVSFSTLSLAGHRPSSPLPRMRQDRVSQRVAASSSLPRSAARHSRRSSLWPSGVTNLAAEAAESLGTSSSWVSPHSSMGSSSSRPQAMEVVGTPKIWKLLSRISKPRMTSRLSRPMGAAFSAVRRLAPALAIMLMMTMTHTTTQGMRKRFKQLKSFPSLKRSSQRLSSSVPLGSGNSPMQGFCITRQHPQQHPGPQHSPFFLPLNMGLM
mmetsp:Transcript_74963/g.188718  ORF Transcript_74963/g.188718 Transcript_74963/m.188718 type:complete len:211 (-) Transcript_74963:1931-2563(-)